MDEIKFFVFIGTLVTIWSLHRLNKGPVPYWRFLAYSSLSAAFSHSVISLIGGTFWRLDWYVIGLFAAVLIAVPVAIVAGLYELIFVAKGDKSEVEETNDST